MDLGSTPVCPHVIRENFPTAVVEAPTMWRGLPPFLENWGKRPELRRVESAVLGVGSFFPFSIGIHGGVPANAESGELDLGRCGWRCAMCVMQSKHSTHPCHPATNSTNLTVEGLFPSSGTHGTCVTVTGSRSIWIWHLSSATLALSSIIRW